MRIRVCLLVVFMALALQAQTQMNLDQLKQMITSSMALKHDDKSIADYLKHVKLTERLNDETIEQLMGMGIGCPDDSCAAGAARSIRKARSRSSRLPPNKTSLPWC